MSTPEPGPWLERRYADLQLHVQMRVVNTAVVEYEVRELILYGDEAEGSDGLLFNCTTATGGSGVTPHIAAADATYWAMVLLRRMSPRTSTGHLSLY